MRLFLAWVASMVAADLALPQATVSNLSQILQPSIDDIASTAPNTPERTLAVTRLLNRPGLVAAATDTEDLRFIVEANRIDKQVGGSAGASGSTNLVSSGSIPRLLGIAMEHGALTQTVSGTTITFRTNPAGVLQALRSGGLVSPQQDAATRNTVDFLQRFNVGLTFDTSRENDGRFTGSYRQLQEASTQIYLYNRRDPNHQKWQEIWNEFRQTVSTPGAPGSQLANALNAFGVSYRTAAAYDSLRQSAMARLTSATQDQAEITAIVTEYVQTAAQFVASGSQGRDVTRLWAQYLREQKVVYDGIARSPVLTFEYVLTRPPVQNAPSNATTAVAAATLPDLSVLRLVFVRPFIGSSDMTLTSSMGIFNNALPSMRGNIRDWQVGGKLDFRLPELAGRSHGQLTFSGLYMNLRQDALGVPATINGKPAGPKGQIGFFQARVRFPLGDSGFSVPLSMTVASRTDLIDETEVRGNIGLTFDLDKLFWRTTAR